MPTIRQKLFAWLLKKGDTFNELMYRGYKTELFKDIKGTVVEIGPGTGINLRLLPPGIEWIGLEPNTAFYESIRNTAHERNIKVTLLTSGAEQIQLPDESADVVISTLVLCSVASQQKVLQEIKRVLKKGGKLIFIEHVADIPGTTLRKVQNVVNPLNRLMADGCNCNRETWLAIEQAGFSSVSLHHEKVKRAMSLHAPHIFGYAVK